MSSWTCNKIRPNLNLVPPTHADLADGAHLDDIYSHGPRRRCDAVGSSVGSTSPSPLRGSGETGDSRPATRPKIAGGWLDSGQRDHLAADLGEALCGSLDAHEIFRIDGDDVAGIKPSVDERQAIVPEIQSGFDVMTDDVSTHFWLQLPDPWRGNAFARAASQGGVGVFSGEVFTVGRDSVAYALRDILTSGGRLFDTMI